MAGVKRATRVGSNPANARAVPAPPPEHGGPAEPRLRPFEDEELEEPAVRAERNAPLAVVVRDLGLAAGPVTAAGALDSAAVGVGWRSRCGTCSSAGAAAGGGTWAAFSLPGHAQAGGGHGTRTRHACRSRRCSCDRRSPSPGGAESGRGAGGMRVGASRVAGAVRGCSRRFPLLAPASRTTMSRTSQRRDREEPAHRCRLVTHAVALGPLRLCPAGALAPLPPGELPGHEADDEADDDPARRIEVDDEPPHQAQCRQEPEKRGVARRDLFHRHDFTPLPFAGSTDANRRGFPGFSPARLLLVFSAVFHQREWRDPPSDLFRGFVNNCHN